MTTLDKAIGIFGFENPITITIAILEEEGKTELAKQLYEECAKEVFDDDFEEDCDYDGGYEPNEIVLNPFASCYFWDC